MLVPVREYSNTAEMLSSLMTIRRGFRTYRRSVVPPILKAVEPEPDDDVTAPPPAMLEATPIANDNEANLASLIPRRVTVQDVLRAVSLVWGVSVADIISAKRTYNVMRPRHAAYALARRLTVSSLPAIGRAMGGRDHTTIMSGCKKIAPLMAAIDGVLREESSPHRWALTLKEKMDGAVATDSEQSKVSGFRRRKGSPHQLHEGTRAEI
jgi:hypothetical protein